MPSQYYYSITVSATTESERRKLLACDLETPLPTISCAALSTALLQALFLICETEIIATPCLIHNSVETLNTINPQEHCGHKKSKAAKAKSQGIFILLAKHCSQSSKANTSVM